MTYGMLRSSWKKSWSFCRMGFPSHCLPHYFLKLKSVFIILSEHRFCMLVPRGMVLEIYFSVMVGMIHAYSPACPGLESWNRVPGHVMSHPFMVHCGAFTNCVVNVFTPDWIFIYLESCWNPNSNNLNWNERWDFFFFFIFLFNKFIVSLPQGITVTVSSINDCSTDRACELSLF